MSSIYPNQTIPTKDKTPEWYSLHLDYAEGVLKINNNVRQRMTRLYQSYNGVKTPESLLWLEKTYGQQNKSRYITYRLGRTKVDLLQGEKLKRPISATVQTINSEAMSEKMAQYNLMYGAMMAKDEIIAIKEKTGVDVMEGAPIPENEEDPIWQKMSFKDKAEDVMQIIADNQIIELDVKKKMADAFLNCIITNHCFVQVERDQNGDVKLHNIDPRDSIYEAVEGDDYLEESPIMGCRRIMPVHQILLRYDLTPEQVKTLEEARKNPSIYVGPNGLARGYMSESNGELVCDVIHVEWDTVTPEYYKIVPKTQSQLALDETDPNLTFQLDPKKYESNKAYHDKMVAEGKYEIVVKYRTEKLEATRIGGIIDVNRRPVYFQKRDVDKPSHILNSTYFGYVHGRVDGVSVSIQQVIENFDNLFDIGMYQIMKEYARAKGKVLAIDRAGLAQGKKLTEVMYEALNDQIIDYDSSAAGNNGSRNLNPATMFQQFDLGVSDSFQYLLQMCQYIIETLNQITGINENRMGITAASSTATAQQSDIANSRTITEALFYGFTGFEKRVVQGIVDASAISWAFYKLDKGEQILGSEKFKFLQITKDIGYRNYGVSIEDGSRYMEISSKIEKMMEFSLNAKEIRPMDALNVLLAQTVAEKKNFLEQSWVEMQKIVQQSQAQQQQVDAQMQQQQLQTQLQIATDTREDEQSAKLDQINLKGEWDLKVANAKAANELNKTHFQAVADTLNAPPPPPM